jgi:hypothetical protein|tara:strand:+ start:1358 stop:1504 length:147 start_codon:yes stop_codon:yes gene_type:complete
MITNFDTTLQSKSSSGGGVIKLLLLAAAVYAGYKFVYLPYTQKKNESK